jgi:hypothetical protein
MMAEQDEAVGLDEIAAVGPGLRGGAAARIDLGDAIGQEGAVVAVRECEEDDRRERKD